MAQPLRSLPPQIKNAPLVVPTRRVKFVRVEVIKASLLIRTTTVHYIFGLAWSNVRSLWVKSGHFRHNHGIMSALGHKQTSPYLHSMSALLPKAAGPASNEVPVMRPPGLAK